MGEVSHTEDNFFQNKDIAQYYTKAYITIAIRLRYDYDKTTTKNWHVRFSLASNRVEWKQVRAMRRSRIVVVSKL